MSKSAGCSSLRPKLGSSTWGLRAGEENVGETGGSLGPGGSVEENKLQVYRKTAQEKIVERDRGHPCVCTRTHTHTHPPPRMCAHTHA